MKLLNYQLSYKSTDAEWIICIHGAGGSIQTWKYQIDAFKKDFNVLAIDLRDHGASKNIEPPYSKYNFDIIVSDVQKVLIQENISHAHFVTLSFGSVLMQAIYERNPQVVQSMILIGGIFNANWMIKGFVHLGRFLNLFLPFPLMYQIFSYLLLPKKNHQASRRVYQMQARKLTSEEYVKWLGIYSEFFLLLRSFNNQSICVPMLVLMGSEDYMFLPSAEKFTKKHQNAELTLVEHAGHICNIEKPTETNTIIKHFLANQISLERKQVSKALSDTN